MTAFKSSIAPSRCCPKKLRSVVFVDYFRSDEESTCAAKARRVGLTSLTMKIITIVCAAAFSAFVVSGSEAESTVTTESFVSKLCTSIVGPAFLISTNRGNTIAAHAGHFPGVSFVSLENGETQGRIQIPFRILAASMSITGDALTLALSENGGVRISKFSPATRKETATQLVAGVDAQLAEFTSDHKYLLGVTTKGSIFRIETARGKLELGEGVVRNAASIAIPPQGDRAFVAGSGLTVVDINSLSIDSKLIEEKNLLEVQISHDGHSGAVRNWHAIELLNLSDFQWSEAVIADPKPDSGSISSARRLAFSLDDSRLFYARSSGLEGELLSLSVSPLQIVARSKIAPNPNAIAVVPERHWVVVSAGGTGREEIAAFDTDSNAVSYRLDLNAKTPASTEPWPHGGCTRN